MSQTFLRVADAHKSFGAVTALTGLDLSLSEGEFFVLLGPSASGKTTTLRSIAGIESLDSGRIEFLGEDVSNAPVQGRSMAMVFQTFALYPHLSVYANLAYPLREQGLPRKEVRQRVGEIADMLGLNHVLRRKPSTASGGEQQRIAIGRALIRRPRLLLLDEPTTNLDAKLRHDTRAEFKRLHRDLGMTMVYATPDELEALSMGQRIGVLDDGAIVQSGSPDELYETPDSVYVASMVGSPKINLVAGRITQGHGIDLGFVEVSEGPWRQALQQFDVGTEITFGFRPFDVDIANAQASTSFNATVELIEPLGDITIVDMRVRETPFRMVLPEAQALHYRIGQQIDVSIDSDQTQLFARETGVAIR